ncbi:CidA/LrgA family protein [Devosia sp. RR2S18]|nr:CidA/LrgA family protein [Devosia sp. RR2S18]WIJ26998.1 CidA/LrgA family protein [Devosia sp. RR2S18]
MCEGERPFLQPRDWVAGLSLLILCQLAGEVLVLAARLMLPSLLFPGPILGLLLLLVVLKVLGERAQAVVGVGNALLGILTLLFVPSAVGIMQQGELIRDWGLPLLLAVVVSTVMTLLVTVGAFIGTERLLARKRS